MFLKMRKLCEEYRILQFAFVGSVFLTASVHSSESEVRVSSGTPPVALASNLASNINSLTQALELAIQNDPWQHTAAFKQRASVAEGEALNTFDDPVLSLGLQNLPTSGFAFDQEPMTQLKLGVSQMLPQGDSRALARDRAVSRGQQYPILSTQRELDIKVALATQWVEAQRIQQQLHYIERQRE